MFRKGLAVAVMLLFIGMCIVHSTAVQELKEKQSPVSFYGNTLYVGGSGEGNYTKIQDAIDNSSDGDTIFVYDDSSPYYENVVIDKSINLIGEDSNTTVIYGLEWDVTIEFHCDNTKISGFTVKTYEFKAFHLINSCFNIISHNKIISFGYDVFRPPGDIYLEDDSHDNIIANNTITTIDCSFRIGIYISSNCARNIISDNLVMSYIIALN